MFIQTEAMPDLSRMKFFPGETVLTAGSAEFINEEQAKRSPLATRLFEIEGVKTVSLYNDFVTISKDETIDWQLMKPLILGAIMDHYTAGDAVIHSAEENESDADLEEALEALFVPNKDDVVPNHRLIAASSEQIAQTETIQNLLKPSWTASFAQLHCRSTGQSLSVSVSCILYTT